MQSYTCVLWPAERLAGCGIEAPRSPRGSHDAHGRIACMGDASRRTLCYIVALVAVRDVVRVVCSRRRKAAMKIAVRIKTMVGAGALSRKKLP